MGKIAILTEAASNFADYAVIQWAVDWNHNMAY